MRARSRRRLLGLLGLLTLGVLVADLAGAPPAGQLRAAGATAFGPVQRVLAGPRDDVDDLEAENARLRVELTLSQHELDQADDLRRLLDTDAAAGQRLVAARVVATELGPLGRALTLDVGARDGVITDSTVLAADGLVGRVVAVGPWTSDVQVLGSSGSVVGVRVGDAGILGTVSPGSASTHVTRPPGTLSLDLARPGVVRVGDAVVTLGSVGGRPYVGGVPLGTVTAVDPDLGLPTRSATVTPLVDLESVDVVAVVLPEARGAPREVHP